MSSESIPGRFQCSVTDPAGPQIVSFDGNADHDRSHDIIDFEVTFRAVLMGIVAADASLGYSKIWIYVTPPSFTNPV